MNHNLTKLAYFIFYFFQFLPFYATGTTSILTDEETASFKDLYIDFDDSMHHGYEPKEYTRRLLRKNNETELLFLKQLYEKNNFLKKLEQLQTKNLSLTTKIPKIIHQIWLGSPLPEIYQCYQESWKHHHPDWEYRLWTDADVAAFKLINQKAFDKGRNYAQKSDIWRYEILERFGGVYIDSDIECLQKIDLFHELYDFYAGLAPITRKTLINNAIIGIVPHHPILTTCIKTINATKKVHLLDTLTSCGPIFFSTIVMDFCMSSANTENILILPPTYFYPTDGVTNTAKDPGIVLKSSFAIHYWANQWHGKNYK